eukprot:2112490-Rhodomonas_salina.1
MPPSGWQPASDGARYAGPGIHSADSDVEALTESGSGPSKIELSCVQVVKCVPRPWPQLGELGSPDSERLTILHPLGQDWGVEVAKVAREVYVLIALCTGSPCREPEHFLLQVLNGAQCSDRDRDHSVTVGGFGDSIRLRGAGPGLKRTRRAASESGRGEPERDAGDTEGLAETQGPGSLSRAEV